MTSPDGPGIRPGRAPLDVAALRSRLVGTGRFVTGVSVAEQTTSTNSDLLKAAAQGASPGTVLIAEYQTSGRGRFERVWSSPPRAGLTLSVLVRPDAVPPARWGWLPLLTGVALRAAVQAQLPPGQAGHVNLKWPNDLLIGPSARKGAGILAQAGDGCVVLGLGINVDQLADELPGPPAGSLRTEFGADVDRAELLVALLDELASHYLNWCAAGGDPDASGLRAAYEGACATLGTSVEVAGEGAARSATAVAIDAAGALVLTTATGPVTISAGDVVHIRPMAR